MVRAHWANVCSSQNIEGGARRPPVPIHMSIFSNYIKLHYLNTYIELCAIQHFYFVCFSQLDTPSTPGVFVFTMKWGHAYADLSLFV